MRQVVNEFINPIAANDLTGWSGNCTPGSSGFSQTRVLDSEFEGGTAVDVTADLSAANETVWHWIPGPGYLMNPISEGQVLWVSAKIKLIEAPTDLVFVRLYITFIDSDANGIGSTTMDSASVFIEENEIKFIEGFDTAPVGAVGYIATLTTVAKDAGIHTVRAGEIANILDPPAGISDQLPIGTNADGNWHSEELFDDFNTEEGFFQWLFPAATGIDLIDGEFVISNTTEKRLIRTYPWMINGEATLEYKAGTTPNSGSTGISLTPTSEHYLLVTAWSDVITIWKRFWNGSSWQFTSLSVSSETLGLVAGDTYWIKIKLDGATITGEHYSSDPKLGATPDVTTSFTITDPSDLSTYTNVGMLPQIRVIPNNNTWTYKSLEVKVTTPLAHASKSVMNITSYDPGPFWRGFNDRTPADNSLDPIKNAELTQAVGSNMVRIATNFPNQAQMTSTDEINWRNTPLAEYMDEYRKRNIKVLLTVGYPASWMAQGSTASGAMALIEPEYYEANALLYRAIIDEWPDVVQAVEYGNEPNLEFFWEGGADASQYVDQLEVFYNIIKDKYPNLPVLAPSLSHIIATTGGDIGVYDYLVDFYTANGQNYCDAISIHPYPYYTPTNDRVTSSGAPFSLWGSGYSWCMANVRFAMNEYNDDRPIWITELGITNIVSDEKQAVGLALLSRMARRDPQIKSIFIHQFIDPIENTSVQFGVLDQFTQGYKKAFRYLIDEWNVYPIFSVPITPRDPSGPIVDWRFYLADSETMEIIEEISYVKSKQLQLQHNRPGSLTFSLNSQEDICEEIIPKHTCVIAKRNKNVLWSGPVWRREVNFPDGNLSVSCVGWFEELNYRELREDYPAVLGRTDFEIVEDMIEIVTTADPSAPGHITLGTMTSSPEGSPLARNIGYTRGEKIGTIIQQLSDIEAGYDFWVDPVTRQLHLRAWNLYEDISDDVIFGYCWGPENVSKVGFSEDVSQMINRMTVTGQGNLAVVYEATDSIAEYGLMEGTVSLSDIGDPDTLQAYAYEEVVSLVFSTNGCATDPES